VLYSVVDYNNVMEKLPDFNPNEPISGGNYLDLHPKEPIPEENCPDVVLESKADKVALELKQ